MSFFFQKAATFRAIFLPMFLLWILCVQISVASAQASSGNSEADFWRAVESIPVEGLRLGVAQLLSEVATIENLGKEATESDWIRSSVRIHQYGFAIVERLIDRAGQNGVSGTERAHITLLLRTLYKLQAALPKLRSPFLVKILGTTGYQLADYRVNALDRASLMPRQSPQLMDLRSKWQKRKDTLWRQRSVPMNGLYSFGRTYSSFLIAIGMLTFAQLATNYAENPVGLDQYLDHALDPYGALAFAAFMGTNHTLVQHLMTSRRSRLGRALIPYIGMAVGFLASSIVYEFATDRSVKKCVRSLFRDEEACDASYERWVIHKKIIQYSPTLVSLLTSAGLAGAFTYIGVNVGKAVGSTVFSGITFGPKAQVLGTYSKQILLSRYAVSTGFFVVFLGIESVVSPAVTNYVERKKMTSFDVQAWLDKRYFHMDYRNKKTAGSPYYIEDVFDVEATNLPTSHGYLAQIQQELRDGDGMFTDPRSQYDCWFEARGNTENMMDQFEITENEDDGTVSVGFSVLERTRRTEAQYNCEVLSQPARLLQRYGKVQGVWRGFLLKDFVQGMGNWLNWSGKFSTMYSLSHKFYEKIAQMKMDAYQNGKEPDLSEDALVDMVLGFMGGEVDPSPTPMNAERQMLLRNFARQKVGFILTRMACGETVKKSSEKNKNRVSGWIAKFFAFIGQESEHSTFRTGFGSAASFLPPSVILQPQLNVCLQRDLSRYSKERVEERKKQIAQLQEQGLSSLSMDDVFHGGWEHDSGARYSDLAHLVFDQLDPAVWKRDTSSISNFNLWWNDNVQQPVGVVWEHYRRFYVDLFESEFLPTLQAKREDCGSSCTEEDFWPAGVMESYVDNVELYCEMALAMIDKLSEKQKGLLASHGIRSYVQIVRRKVSKFQRELETGSEWNLARLLESIEAFNSDQSGSDDMILRFERFSDEYMQSLFFNTSKDQGEEPDGKENERLTDEIILASKNINFLKALIGKIQSVEIAISNFAEYGKIMDFNVELSASQKKLETHMEHPLLKVVPPQSERRNFEAMSEAIWSPGERIDFLDPEPSEESP